MAKHITGSIPALITPMKENFTVDEKRFQDFVSWQITQGSHGVVPVGTTGESPTLSHEEHEKVIRLCIEAVNGRVPVIAGTGSNNTTEAVHLSQQAQSAGADAILVVTPYYNKPSQDGLYLHFSSIAQAVQLPIFIYNIPGRCIVDMSVDTMHRLVTDYPHIIGVKDATASLDRPLETRLQMGESFIQLSGEDATIAAFLAQGGHGWISVTANVAPQLLSRLYTAWNDKDLQTFANIRDQLMPLHQAMFCAPSPAPAKYALFLLGHTAPWCRSPIAPLDKPTKERIQKAMEQAQLI